MQTLEDVINLDARARRDSLLTPEQFRAVLEGAVPIFRQMTMRSAVPVTVVEDPGVLKSRHIEVVDISAANHGMAGTGGQWDRADQKTVDEVAYAIWKNVQVPWREQKASERGGFDLLRESGQVAAEQVVVSENALLTKGLGPVKGITNATGIQTFAGATWATAGNAYDNVVTALEDKMATKGVPRDQAALLVNPAEKAKLHKKHSSTAVAQIQDLREMLPGGIYSHTDCPAGKAYVYARTPTVLEARVYQDLTVVPLPKVDEDERLRVRTIMAFHKRKADGIVEITGVA